VHARHRHDKRQPPSSWNITQVRPRRVYIGRTDLNARNGTYLSGNGAGRTRPKFQRENGVPRNSLALGSSSPVAHLFLLGSRESQYRRCSDSSENRGPTIATAVPRARVVFLARETFTIAFMT